jgi:2-oxoglutarate dehydrogenase E1 component
LEQLYPLRGEQLLEALAPVGPAAPVTWIQEEPENQGAWRYIARTAPPYLGGRTLVGLSRPAAASPATGSRAAHVAESAALLDRAFAR